MLAQEDSARISSGRVGGEPECSSGDYEYPAYWLRLAGGLVAIPRGKRRSYGVNMPRVKGEYEAYMKSDAWAAMKTRWIKSPLCKGHVCHAKGCSSSKHIEFHHKTYARLGKENLSDIVMICRECHTKIHKLKRSGFSLKDASSMVLDL